MVFQLQKFFLLFFIQGFLLVSGVSGQMAFYPSYDDVQKFCTGTAEKFNHIVTYNVLGKSSEGDHDLIALKITGAESKEFHKPVWVFTGSIHGNEQMGVRLIVDLISELTEKYNVDPDVTAWVDAYEIWIIPTMNPWGYINNRRHNRAKTRDTNSGVDMNRNYDFRWKAGGDTTPMSNTYRGVAAFSENETRILRNLYLELKPLFGVTFHQLNNFDGGQIMVPWRSNRNAPAPPDSGVIQSYANQFADWVYASRLQGDLCRKLADGSLALQDPDGSPCGTDMDSARYCQELCWRPTVSKLGAYGQSSNFNYAAAGTIDMTVELSHRLFNVPSMHTVSGAQKTYDSTVNAIATEIVRNNLDAVKAWMSYFLVRNSKRKTAFRGPGITGRISDSRSGQPVHAVIEVAEYGSPLIEDRTTDKDGVFWRLLPEEGKCTIKISASGYIPQTLKTDIKKGTLKNLDVKLVPEK